MLSNTLALSQDKIDFIMKARQEYGDTATRSQLKDFNRHLGKRSSPVFITKNLAFKLNGQRGVYNLAAIDKRTEEDIALAAASHHAAPRKAAAKAPRKAAAKKVAAPKKVAAKKAVAGPRTSTKKAVKKASEKSHHTKPSHTKAAAE